MWRRSRLIGNPTITCQRAGISSARSTAPGGALVREVPSVEEPAESAASASIARETGLFGGSPEQRDLQVNSSFKYSVFSRVWKNYFSRSAMSA